MKVLCSVMSCLVFSSALFCQVQVVPCQLTNADQDTLRLFPDRTNYRTEFLRTDNVESSRGLKPNELYRKLELRLGDRWDPIWETPDIPYVFYEILKGPDRIGWIFGANQGWPGADNSQLMVAIDLEGRIIEFYYQKLPSSENAVLQNADFYSQFIGLTLEHFYVHDRLQELKNDDPALQAIDMIQRIHDPTKTEHEGFQKTLRGLKKILIYLDDFKFQNRIKKEEVFKNVDYIIKNKASLPLLTQESILDAKDVFPEASRSVVDLVSVADTKPALEERLGSPMGENTVYLVNVVYRDTMYQKPFVRGTLLGYEVALQEDSLTGAVGIGAQGANFGKILGIGVNTTSFPQMNGLSLVHFYTKDFLTKAHLADEKLDKISHLINVMIDGKDRSDDIRVMAKKALIIVDEQYFHNYFMKDEIMKKIEEYKSRQSP